MTEAGFNQQAEQKAHQSSSSGQPQPLAEKVLQVAKKTFRPAWQGGLLFPEALRDGQESLLAAAQAAQAAQATERPNAWGRACCQCSKCNLPGPHGSERKPPANTTAAMS